MKKYKSQIIFFIVWGAIASNYCHAQENSTQSFLQGTIFEEVAQKHQVDANLLYSISLIESAKKVKNSDLVAPSPYAIRSPQGAIYPKTYEDACKKLEFLLSKYKSKEIDIGLMQINGQHWKNLEQAKELLKPQNNLEFSAKLLASAINSTKDSKDLELGIGRYHSYTEWRARNYGSRVLAVYKNLLRID